MRTRILAMALAPGLLAGTACRDVPQGPVDPVVRLASATVWSNGEVRITGPALGPGAALEALVSGVPAEFERLDDTTLVVTLPDPPGGPLALSVLRNGTALVVEGYVEVAGYRDVTAFPDLPWTLQPLGTALHPMAMGFSNASGQATVYDPRDGTSRAYPAIPRLMLDAPGVSYRANAIVVADTQTYAFAGTADIWDLQSGPAKVASYHGNLTGYPLLLTEPAPSRLMVSTPHETLFLAADDSGHVTTLFSDENEATKRVVLSPRGDRVTIEVNGTFDGVPVFDLVHDTIAFRAPLLRNWNGGAVFSSDGAVVYFVADSAVASHNDDSLTVAVAMDATSGAVLAYRRLPGTPLGLALDPMNGSLVVPTMEPGDSAPSLALLDPASLDTLRILRPPHDAVACGCLAGGVTLVDPLIPAAFYLQQRQSFRYDLLSP